MSDSQNITNANENISKENPSTAKLCCYKITGKVMSEAFLHIGNGKRTGIIKHTLSFIPGSVIRGAFGNLLRLIINKEKDDIFLSSLFDDETDNKSSEIFFKNCYPLHLKCSQSNTLTYSPVFVPVPKILFVCQNKQCGKLYDTFEPPLQCEICGKSVKPVNGFICNNCGETRLYPVGIKRMYHVPIDRYNNSAAIMIGENGTDKDIDIENDDKNENGIEQSQSSLKNNIKSYGRESDDKHGLLHTVEVIEKGSEFGLEIILSSSIESSAIDKIISLLSRGLQDEGVGGSKSRGLGKITIRDIKVEKITTDVIEGKAKILQGVNNNGGQKSNKIKVIALSPIVIDSIENKLEPSTLLESARRAYSWCFKEGKPSLVEVKKIKQTYSYEVFGGWSLKEDRLKRNAISIQSGSVFLFGLPDDVEERFTLTRALASLEYYAIGGYKAHGYGQIRILPYMS